METVSVTEVESRLKEGWTLTGQQTVIAGKVRSVKMNPPADHDPMRFWKDRQAAFNKMTRRERELQRLRNRGLDV